MFKPASGARSVDAVDGDALRLVYPAGDDLS